jgi:demethoxyubiquinone hydroxylase (CLK1/Coq7/Cat5 family)
MISKEDEKRVLDFSNEYRKRAEKVSGYKDQLQELQNVITKELEEMQVMREDELAFLDELKDKYETTPEVVVELIQKIVLANG